MKVIVLLWMTAACWAQSLTPTDIERLLKARISEAVIIATVQQAGPVTVPADEVIKLKQLGASDTLLQGIMKKPVDVVGGALEKRPALDLGVYAR